MGEELDWQLIRDGLEVVAGESQSPHRGSVHSDIRRWRGTSVQPRTLSWRGARGTARMSECWWCGSAQGIERVYADVFGRVLRRWICRVCCAALERLENM